MPENTDPNADQNSDLLVNQDQQSNIIAVLDALTALYNLEIDTQQLVYTLTPIAKMPEELLEKALEQLGFEFKTTIAKTLDINMAEHVSIINQNGSFRLVGAQNSEHTNEQELIEYSGLHIAILNAPDYYKTAHTEHMGKTYALDWFWTPIIQFRKSYYEILLISFFINVFVLAIPLFSMNVYDRVVLNFAQETLSVLTIGVCIALLFDLLFKTIRAYILERVAERLGNDHDYKLMERLNRIDSNILPLSIGEKTNLFRELQSVREFYASRLVPTMIDIPFILLFLLVIYLISPILALVPAIMMVIILIINFFVHIPIEKTTEEYFSAIQKKNSFLVETLAGTETVKNSNATGNRLFHWRNFAHKASHVTRRNNFIIGATSNMTFALTQMAHVAIIFLGVYEIQDNQLTIGGLIACSIISSRAIAPIMNLSSLLARLKQSKDLLVSIDKIFQYPCPTNEQLWIQSKQPLKGSVEIKDLEFSYSQGDDKIIKSINCAISAGEHVGIIGQNGAGKTTLAKLISGLLKPTAGDIKLDNYDYASLSVSDISKTIAYAPQDPFFFRGTILYNVTLGRETILPESLETAVRVSGLAWLLKQSGKAMDMNVEENGKNLSGGIKQAISLARALVSDPDILIFDEPTTGMDSALEKHVLSELFKYVENKTFIMVTHRTSLLALVNRLIFITNGNISADGPKDAVLKQLQNG